MTDTNLTPDRLTSPCFLYPARNLSGNREVISEEIRISVFRAGQGAMPLPSRGGQNG